MKSCTTCHEFKLPYQFNKDKNSRDKLSHACKDCNKKRMRARDKGKMRAYYINYYSKNKERRLEDRKRYLSNPIKAEMHRASSRAWRKANPELRTAQHAKRRAAKLNATPSWANHKYINLFYKFAKIEEKRVGEAVHVDHIIPLVSEEVCGLHCEDNLQLLLASVNLKKKNKLYSPL